MNPTGIVDGELRVLITSPRCGVPDNMVDLDPSDKWAPGDTPFGPGAGGMFSNNWYVNSSVLGNLTLAQVRGAAGNAAMTWMQQTSLTMAEANDFGAPITIMFENLDNPLVFASTNAQNPLDAGGIHVNTQINWTTATPPAAGSPPWDLESTLLHEMGHALGLGHSAWGMSLPNGNIVGALMFPFRNITTRVLDPDDIVAMSALWDTY